MFEPPKVLKILLVLNIFGFGASAWAQSGQLSAVDISVAEIKQVQKTEPPKTDQQLKIVDMGKYNLGVGVIHRGPIKAGVPLTGFSHDQTGET